MKYPDLFKCIASDGRLTQQERKQLYKYLREVIQVRVYVDPTESLEIESYLTYSEQFRTRIKMPPKWDALLIDIIQKEIAPPVQPVVDNKQAIINQLVSILNMVDFANKSFMLSMEIGEKRIHLRID